ncbi:MAG: hypothetical protein AAF889_02780 [Cyanobacteria bacterium P01_D01_bin.73]
MADLIQGLESKLQGLSNETQAIAQQLYDADHNYLEILGKTARQQLILACYQICTTQYPEEFLVLETEQKKALQNKVKFLASELQQYLLSVLELDVELRPSHPDSFQEFIISSLFSNAKVSRKRRGKNSRKFPKADRSDESSEESNRTLVVLSEDFAVGELSESGLSPERLAEALANALESVISEDKDSSEAGKDDSDGNSEGDEIIESKSSEEEENDESKNQLDSNDIDRVIKKKVDSDLTVLETESDGVEDKNIDIDADSESISSASETEDRSYEERDADASTTIDGDRPDTDQEVAEVSESSDVSSSFLGQYFASNETSSDGQDKGDEAPGTTVGSANSSIENLGLSPLELGGADLDDASLLLINDNGSTPSVEITQSQVPHEIMQWQRSRERLVLSSLQKFSYRTNRLLRTSKAIPEPLANPFIEGDLSLSRDSSSKTPNLLALTIEPTKAPPIDGQGKPMRMVAVHLNLSDLELANPELRRQSLRIRKLFNQLETLNQRHQDAQKKLNIAQADVAWRNSWSNEI